MTHIESTEFQQSGAGVDDDHVPGESAYDRHYKSGGFGYDADRDRWVEWVQANYIDRFGLQPGRLLDVGCGDGFWASIFADKDFQVSGFDTSPAGVAAAQRRCPDGLFVTLTLDEELPYPAGSFDVVFCRAISHVCGPDLTDPRVVSGFARAWDLVAPEGVLLLSCFTTQDGEMRGSTKMHTEADLAALLETVTGRQPDTDWVANYLQLLVKR